MSMDKYLNILLCQIEAIVFIILHIFWTTCAVLKTGEYHLDIPMPSFTSGIFSHMIHLDQSCVIENILWIITNNITIY